MAKTTKPKTDATSTDSTKPKTKSAHPKRAAEGSWLETVDNPPKLEEVELQTEDDEWHVPAANHQGHSTRLQCRVPPLMAREVERIIHRWMGTLPYETMEDLLRHAIHRHIYFLHRVMPSTPRTILAAMEASITVLNDDAHATKLREMIGKLEESCYHHMKDGNLGEAQRIMWAIISNIRQVPHNSIWKAQSTQRIENIKAKLIEATQLYEQQQQQGEAKAKRGSHTPDPNPPVDGPRMTATRLSYLPTPPRED